MLRRVEKVRLYPTDEQKQTLAQMFGCTRWFWNYALNKSVETYKETGKGLSQYAINALLPPLKKAEETKWLGDCYSQVLQCVSLNLSTAYKNFFDKRSGFPKYKSKHGKQSLQYPQSVKVVTENTIKFPGKLGAVKATITRDYQGKIKTVTITKTPTDKYFASIIYELEGEDPTPTTEGKVIGIDLGIKHFAVVSDGTKVSKYDNPRHTKKHAKNLKRKQQKLARKKDGSNSRKKAKKLVAKVHERITNSRQDFLHKLSHKLTNENQVVVVENLNVKGMVKNHKLSKAISDTGWGTFVNFLAYKLERKGGKLIEIDRWFPSSKICSVCYHQASEMPLDVREWTCSHCGTKHDRDGNAATNIRAEGIRLSTTDGIAVAADGGEVRPKKGRKSVLRRFPVKSETVTKPQG